MINRVLRVVSVILLTVAFCGWQIYMWFPFVEPLTGMTLTRFITITSIATALLGISLFILMVTEGRRAIAVVLLIPVGIIGLPPMPSMGGVPSTIHNDTAITHDITIFRSDNLKRHVGVAVGPHKTVVSKTAPGDWASDLSLTVEVGARSLKTNISVFHKQEIVVGENSVELKDLRAKKPSTLNQ